MFGYRRIVTTLGERLGKIHITPAQGASAEVVSAVVIGAAGLTGLPVSTTHIVTSGIAGTMVTAGAGLQHLFRSSTRLKMSRFCAFRR
jgi:PiT family inorganic phosphate transporter